jgi:dihydroorotate dehydrogenase electron transfer subunit
MTPRPDAAARQTLSRLKEPCLKLGTVAGILTTRPGLIAWADRHLPEVELITTKSYQVAPNPGYREPVVVEAAAGCFGNAVGLRNPGMQRGVQELQRLRGRHRLRALLNVSLAGGSLEEFRVLARGFAPVADLLELNLSCPHAEAGYGASIGSDPRTVHRFVGAVRQVTRRPLLVKLTPNVAEIGAIARAAVEAGADGIAAINTVGPETFLEPQSGLPILSNPNGGKGGRSGAWILETALRKVAEVRAAVGPELPIVGIGGLARGADLLAMRAAGADVMGLGSALARVPRQDLLPLYVAALLQDCREGTDLAAGFLLDRRLMEYRPFAVRSVEDLGTTLRVLVLEGKLPAKASQFAFLFIPGVGEKPFSVARADPLTFLVRRRGPFTEALFAMRPGAQVLVRGAYGAEVPRPLPGTAASSRGEPGGRAIVVAGGTGAAVAAPLAAELQQKGARVEVYLGVSRPEENALGTLLSPSIPCTVAADEGRPGRVLEALRRLPPAVFRDADFYNVGPPGLLRGAAELQQELGADPRRIFLGLETPCLCGVGLCGACECGGRLLCKEGTFVSLQFLQSAGIGLEELLEQAPAEPLSPRMERRQAGSERLPVGAPAH